MDPARSPFCLSVPHCRTTGAGAANGGVRRPGGQQTDATVVEVIATGLEMVIQ